MNMTRAFLACAALVATMAGASAADLGARPIYKAPPAPVVYNWTGFYVGGNAGYGWGSNAVALSGDPFSLFVSGLNAGTFPSSIGSKPRGFVGGGQLGWNYQTGSYVFGLEGDIDFTDLKSSGSVVTAAPVAPGVGIPRTLSGSQKLDWLATFRARAGITATDRLLLYVTGGGAAGHGSVSASLTTNDFAGAPGSGCVAGTCETASFTDTRFGWAAGAGLEYAMWGNWSIKAEYLHYDLGSISVTAADARFPAGTNILVGSVPLRGDIVRGGVNVKFGP
jgi:outer membrane immunogenic protein